MVLEAPAPSPGTGGQPAGDPQHGGPPWNGPPPRGAAPERVSDASPMAMGTEMDRRESPADRRKATRVVSSKVSVGKRLTEIWASRELLVTMVWTEIKVKYKNSFLGLLWSMLSPAMTLLVYTMVFGVFLKNGIPKFVIFLFSGLLIWNFFSTGVITATGVVVNNAGLVKKVSFPREILALAALGSAGVFFFFQACVMALFLVLLKNSPAYELMWLLLVALIPMMVFASALAMLLASINVYLRDTQHLVEVIVGAAWFWACPIVYSYYNTIYPKMAQHHIPTWIYLVNPMTPLSMTFQRVLYNHMGKVTLTSVGHPKAELLPPWGPLTYVWMDALVLAAALVLFYVGMLVFGRLSGNFAEEL